MSKANLLWVTSQDELPGLQDWHPADSFDRLRSFVDDADVKVDIVELSRACTVACRQDNLAVHDKSSLVEMKAI